jgi:hypothetical protein
MSVPAGEGRNKWHLDMSGSCLVVALFQMQWPLTMCSIVTAERIELCSAEATGWSVVVISFNRRVAALDDAE